MQTAKTGIRVLGIAESFVRGARRSVFAGIVMRKDLIVDGVSFSSVTIGGTDATDGIVSLFESLCREDIHCIMLSGCVVSWFNVINLDEVFLRTGLPVICVTYEESEGLEEYIRTHFPDDSKRLSDYLKVGTRTPFIMKNGYTVFLRVSGISVEDAGFYCDAYIREGKIPEPLRVARLIARGVLRNLSNKSLDFTN